MAYKIELVDNEQGIVTIFSDTFSQVDMDSSTAEKLAMPYNPKTVFVLNDFSAVNNVDVPTNSIRENAATTVKAATEHQPLFHATVMPSDLLAGLGRLWASNAGDSGWKLHTYRERADAEKAIRVEFQTDFTFQ